MNTLIVGGTSGLGLELAREFTTAGDEVIVTGRKKPSEEFIDFRQFNLSEEHLAVRTKEFVAGLPEIGRFVYAAGYYLEGRVTDLTPEQIEEMIDVGGRGLIYFVKWLLEKQDKLVELVTITSRSQWIPREKEPVYNFAKAGAALFSAAVAEDERVGKVLVVAPGGMNTPFWKGVERDDLQGMMQPAYVAGEVVNLLTDEYRYRFAQVLYNPLRTEIGETKL